MKPPSCLWWDCVLLFQFLMAFKQSLDLSSPSSTKWSWSWSALREISPEASVNVKDTVTSLSPSKPSNHVFFGELSDGDSIIPLIELDKAHRQFLDEHMDNESPVTLRNCLTSTNKTTGKLQLVVKSYTHLEKSQDKNLYVADRSTTDSPVVSIDQLNTYEQYDRVTACITALKVKTPVAVKNNKQKLEVIIGDDTAYIGKKRRRFTGLQDLLQ